MRKYVLQFLVCLLAWGFYTDVNAQTKEINPNVQWRFIRSDTVEWVNQQLFTFEFPAQKGYDYFFNLTHGYDSLAASIEVFDLQMKPIDMVKDSLNTLEITLFFDVQKTGTYKVYLYATDPNQDAEARLKGLFSLVRRLKA